MIEIACSADTPYLPHVSVMLHSLLTHTPERPLRVWILHGKPLSEDGCERVAQVVTGFGAQLKFLQVPDALMTGFPTAKFHYSCWYRILLPDLLPDLRRILYLDCDMIVMDDVKPLWDIDLGDNSFAACINPLYTPMYKWMRGLGITNYRDYLNSGALLLDLERLRAEGLSQRLREYAITHPDNHCPEQDALSVLMKGRWLSLHPRWNVQTALYDNDLPASMSPFTPEQSREAVEHPAIVHFNGPFKPWQYLCKHPLRHLYYDHLRRTSWPEQSLKYTGLGYRLIRPLSIGMQFRILLYLRPLWQKVRNFFVNSAKKSQGSEIR
jgi:lipopolysaccharide biosynthesis glycosyltransferase